MPAHSLLMGQLHVSADRQQISTVLGSCVAVCLWDGRTGMGGMNHFALPRWDGKGLPSPRFGNVAIPALLEAMLQLGARRSALVAKVFGGGSLFGRTDDEGSFNVGSRNADYALASLQRLEIPVVAQRLKPTHGTKIHFDTGTGEVILRRLKRPDSS